MHLSYDEDGVYKQCQKWHLLAPRRLIGDQSGAAPPGQHRGHGTNDTFDADRRRAPRRARVPGGTTRDRRASSIWDWWRHSTITPARIALALVFTSPTCPMGDAIADEAWLALQQALPDREVAGRGRPCACCGSLLRLSEDARAAGLETTDRHDDETSRGRQWPSRGLSARIHPGAGDRARGGVAMLSGLAGGLVHRLAAAAGTFRGAGGAAQRA